MPRTIAVVLFLIIPASLAVIGEEIGLLGEVVPWPILSAEISMHHLPLYDHPLEALITTPIITRGENLYSYGIIPLGSGSDPGVTVAVSQHGEPRILVDANNDENLSNDLVLYERERIDVRTYRWQVPVDVEYDIEGTVTRAPYHLLILANFSYATNQYEYWYGCLCHRCGLIDLDDTLYPVALTDLSSTAKYDDLSHVLVSIDTDGNGKLNMLPGSHEIYGPGDPLQVQVGEVIYVVSAVSEDGRRITLERVGNAEPRAVLSPGHMAPDFVTTTLGGQEIRLSDYRGKVVVLVFHPAPATTGCPMCDTASSPVPDRMADIRDTLALFDDDLVMITIYSGAEPANTNHLPDPELSTEVAVWDPHVAKLYRRSNGLLIIDQNGAIAAMDEAWSSIRCGMPQGGFHYLTPPELQAIITGLLGSHKSH
jgi:hypothetical protein